MIEEMGRTFEYPTLDHKRRRSINLGGGGTKLRRFGVYHAGT